MHNPRVVRAKAKSSKRFMRKVGPNDPVAYAFRHIEPEWRYYVDYARYAAYAGDEQMQKFLAVFDALTYRERETIMPEKVCELAGVSSGELLGAVSRYYWEERKGESALIASANHPRMIQATAFWGQMLADRGEDRELFFRVSGSLPDKKGNSIHNYYNAPNYTFQTQQGQAPSSAGTNGFRTMDQRVIEMGRLLEEPSGEAVFTKDTAHVFTPDRKPED